MTLIIMVVLTAISFSVLGYMKGKNDYINVYTTKIPHDPRTHVIKQSEYPDLEIYTDKSEVIVWIDQIGCHSRDSILIESDALEAVIKRLSEIKVVSIKPEPNIQDVTP